MPKLASTLLAMFVLFAAAPTWADVFDSSPNVETQLEAAYQQLIPGQQVLLVFGASWCPPCHQLVNLMNGDVLEPLVTSQFQLVYVDIGYWNKNMQWDTQTGYPTQGGIPALVTLNQYQQVDRVIHGYDLAEIGLNEAELTEFFFALSHPRQPLGQVILGNEP